MNSKLQEFFRGVSEAIHSNTVDVIIIITLLVAAFSALIYFYYIFPKYNEYAYKKKVNDFLVKRYRLKSYEQKALSNVVRTFDIEPAYLLFISKSIFDHHETDLLNSLKYYCPENIKPEDSFKSLKSRLSD